MTVTKLTEISKSRVQIMIDNEFAFVLYKGELRIYHLREGEKIEEETYREIMQQLLPKRAKLRAMNLLKSRAYTRKQLYDKLKSSGYPQEAIEEALSYVSSFGYINDRQYACDFIEYNKERKSRTGICNTLMQKGIDKSVIEDAWEKMTAGDGNLERDQVIAWVKKKNFNPDSATYEEKQKFCAFLYRKGFQIDTIRSVLSLDII